MSVPRWATLTVMAHEHTFVKHFPPAFSFAAIARPVGKIGEPPMPTPRHSDDYDLAPDPQRATQQRRTGTVAPAAMKNDTTAQPPKAAGGYVRGGRLVVRDGASLPDRCIRCNAPAPEGRITKRFAYNQDESGPGIGTMVPLFGRILWMMWLLRRMKDREYLTVSYCVCKKHRAIKLAAIAAMAIGMIAGAIVFVIGIKNSDPSAQRHAEIDSTTIIIGVLIFFAGALCGLAISSVQVAAALSNGAELKGAGKPFLDSMPQFSKVVGRR